MTLLHITIGISIAVIGLVVYSALVVSSRQEQIAQRVRKENSFKRASYTPHSADRFAFETSEDLVGEDELEEIEENHF